MNREETRALFVEWGNEAPKPVIVRGKTIYVRELSTAEMDKRLIAAKEDWQKELAITSGATAVVCDDQGNPVFDPTLEVDVKIVGKVAWSRINKIVSAMQTDEEETTQGN
ncbi:MAG: hypothetical protein AAAC47_14505 [Pararhizobium sp.]